jgi:putative N-acetylmannosamine-6-phosphate epimerase
VQLCIGANDCNELIDVLGCRALGLDIAYTTLIGKHRYSIIMTE